MERYREAKIEFKMRFGLGTDFEQAKKIIRALCDEYFPWKNEDEGEAYREAYSQLSITAKRQIEMHKFWSES